MSDQPTYCPLCGTKEPHECESKPKPKTKETPMRPRVEEVDLHQQHPSFDIKLDF